MLYLSKIVCFRELGFFTCYVDQKAAVFVREQEAMDQENMNGKRIEISDISIGYQGLCPKGTLRSIIIRAFIMLCHSICVVNLHICSASPASC